jgi:CO dehydrogenase/acetyl-CoA synthase alpha subunit
MKKDLDLKNFKEKTYMFISKEKYFKAQNDMVKFVEDLIDTFTKQKMDILKQMHEAETWYKYNNSNKENEIENFFLDTQE